MTRARIAQKIDDRPPNAELLGVYMNRSEVPAAMWIEPVRLAKRRIAVRVYAGQPFFESTPELLRHLKSRADDGVEVRLLLGDPESDAVAVRGREEGADLAARVRHVLHFLEPVVGYPGIQIRLDSTTLYYWLYVFDDTMIMNQPIVVGRSASMSPHLHLRRPRLNGVFDSYLQNFETLWALAEPYQRRGGSEL